MQSSEIATPILGEFPEQRFEFDPAGLFLCDFEVTLDGVGSSLRIGRANILAVNLPERGVLFNSLIEQGLGNRGIVDFAMTVATVADKIDHDVGAKLVAELGCHAGNTDDSIHVFGVDVKDGNRLATRDAR